MVQIIIFNSALHIQRYSTWNTKYSHLRSWNKLLLVISFLQIKACFMMFETHPFIHCLRIWPDDLDTFWLEPKEFQHPAWQLISQLNRAYCTTEKMDPMSASIVLSLHWTHRASENTVSDSSETLLPSGWNNISYAAQRNKMINQYLKLQLQPVAVKNTSCSSNTRISDYCLSMKKSSNFRNG